MYIEPETQRLHIGNTMIPLSQRELADYQKQRDSIVPGDLAWCDEKVLAFVLWKSGNPGLGAFIEYYDNIELKFNF